MRIIFMGPPDFSVGTLEALVEAGHEVCLVVACLLYTSDAADD